MLEEQVLCRPSEYSIQMRKHFVGRHDALSNRSITNLGQEWLFSELSKHSVARQNALSCRRKYSVARHDALSNCASILSRIRILYLAAGSILSRVKVLPQILINESSLIPPA